MKPKILFIIICIATFNFLTLQTFNCFAQSIAAGDNHSLSLCNDGTVRAWGANGVGQLGNGTNTDSNVPVQVSGLTGAVALAGGAYHSLALKNDGTVRAWGSNISGQLGNGTNTDSNVPVQVVSLCTVGTGIETVSSGSRQLAVEVYPNPFRTNAVVRITNPDGYRDEFTNDDLRFTIYDLLGREVHRQTINSSHETLNLNLTSGIYFYKVTNSLSFGEGRNEVIANGKLAIQ